MKTESIIWKEKGRRLLLVGKWEGVVVFRIFFARILREIRWKGPLQRQANIFSFHISSQILQQRPVLLWHMPLFFFYIPFLLSQLIRSAVPDCLINGCLLSADTGFTISFYHYLFIKYIAHSHWNIYFSKFKILCRFYFDSYSS